MVDVTNTRVCCDPELLFTYFLFSPEDVSPHGSSFVFHILSLYFSHLSSVFPGTDLSFCVSLQFSSGFSSACFCCWPLVFKISALFY